MYKLLKPSEFKYSSTTLYRVPITYSGIIRISYHKFFIRINMSSSHFNPLSYIASFSNDLERLIIRGSDINRNTIATKYSKHI